MTRFATLLALSLCTAGFSQVKDSTERQPTKIKVFTPSASTITSKDNSYRWAVKTDMLGFATGEFPLIAEYRIGKKISVEASAGITYAFLPNGFGLEDGENDDLFDTKAAMGTSFRGAFKFFPSGDYDAIEGWAFGVQVFNKVTNREYKEDAGSGALEGKRDSKTKMGAALVISKQVFQDSNIVFEWMFGVGFAKIDRTYFTESYNSDASATFIEEIKDNKTAPHFQLGFRIGFGN